MPKPQAPKKPKEPDALARLLAEAPTRLKDPSYVAQLSQTLASLSPAALRGRMRSVANIYALACLHPSPHHLPLISDALIQAIKHDPPTLAQATLLYGGIVDFVLS